MVDTIDRVPEVIGFRPIDPCVYKHVSGDTYSVRRRHPDQPHRIGSSTQVRDEGHGRGQHYLVTEVKRDYYEGRTHHHSEEL